MSSTVRLAIPSVLIAAGAIAAYVLLLGVPVVRNHPEGYVLAFAVATGLPILGLWRGGRPRWPAWVALGVSGLLLVGGAWFNFVVARVPDTPPAFRVGDRPPDFTLSDAAGRPVTLADYRGKKPVLLIFYRGYW
jgi:AhpC/TSA family